MAHFDLAAGDLTGTDLRAWSLAEDGDSALALTRDDPARVVRLDPADPDAVEEVVTLAGRARGLLAVDGRRIYVASGDGRLTRYDGASGEVAARVDDGPVVLLSADEGALWTVHPNRAEDFGSPRVVRRNPNTLAPRGGAGAGGTPSDPRVVVALLEGLSGLTDEDDVRLLPSIDPLVHWRTEGLGELERVGADGDEQRFDVHYDSVYGVFETDGGTWLLVQDDQGTIVDVTEVDESRLALWEAWPAG